MNTYIFKPLLKGFDAPEWVPRNEIHFKKLKESIEDVAIEIDTGDLNDALEKAKKELSLLIAVNYGEIPHIEYYVIRLILLSVKVH